LTSGEIQDSKADGWQEADTEKRTETAYLMKREVERRDAS